MNNNLAVLLFFGLVLGQAIPSSGDCTHKDVRLVNGRTAFEGRVEVCVQGVWGTVCDDNWDDQDAVVVCRQLGFNSKDVAYTSVFGGGVGPIHLDEVACNGTEQSLLDCPFQEQDCEHYEDAGVICPSELCNNGSIRLVDGPDNTEGRVEICFDGVWGSVCSDGWDENTNAGTVICRQLGFTSNLGIVVEYYSGGQGPVFLDNIQCSGTEQSLLMCDYDGLGGHTCDQSVPEREDAGVRCLQGCSDMDVRLASSLDHSSRGRLEICCNNTWGTVCDKDWDIHDSLVVCKQLGFSTDYAAASPMFSSDRGPIYYSGVHCEGDENSIFDCSAVKNIDEILEECDHSMDVGIACSPLDCINGDVRVLGGLNNLEGRVQVCVGGGWQSVCGDNWTSKEANVLCVQLGIGDGSALPTTFSVDVNSSAVRSFACVGSEHSVNDCIVGDANEQCLLLAGVVCAAPCHSSGYSMCCTNSRDCLVESDRSDCYCNSHCLTDGNCCRDFLYSEGCIVLSSCIVDHSVCVSGMVRLSGGSSLGNGKLEMCVGQHWVGVCAPQFMDDVTAAVACSQLGYGAEDIVILPSGSYPFSNSVSVNVNGLKCFGNEASITDCYYEQIGNGTCDAESASIICNTAECSGDDLRLTGGTSALNGRVEVCYNGVWATVCMEEWNATSAQVVCRQFGYSVEGESEAVIVPGGKGLIVSSNTVCSGTESSLTECFDSPWSLSRTCGHHLDVGVICSSQNGINSMSAVAVIVITFVGMAFLQ